MDGARARLRAVLGGRVPYVGRREGGARRAHGAHDRLGPQVDRDVGPGVEGSLREQRAGAAVLPRVADQRVQRGAPRRWRAARRARRARHPGRGARARANGVAFMPTPASYYNELPERIVKSGIGKIDEDIATLRDLEILIDGDHDHAYMLQIFLKEAAGLYGDATAGPFFYEIIQRKGDDKFGAGNFRALFESISASSSPRASSKCDRGFDDRSHAARRRGAQAPHAAARAGRRAALRRVHHARRLRGPVLDPLSPAPAAHAPARARAARLGRAVPAPEEVAGRALAKRHYRSDELVRRGGAQMDARVPLLFNRDIAMGVVFPSAPDPVYVADGDADQLLYIHRGGGRLRSLIGDVVFAQGDYVYVPRGLLHRFEPDAAVGAQHWLWMSLTGGVHVPRQWRNDVGQLRMDAPYCHRDFKRPVLAAPYDEGIRELVVRRNGAWHGFVMDHSPLDSSAGMAPCIRGRFRSSRSSRAWLVHLPPTWHGTFAARGALICSFVPRPLDFAPDAIPCPYPHNSTHCDEWIFYCDGNFTSRKGVGPGSISHHPMGVAHGPHPGAYEGSIGASHTSELAVMADTEGSLQATAAALGVEDPEYQDRSCSAPISRRRRS